MSNNELQSIENHSSITSKFTHTNEVSSVMELPWPYPSDLPSVMSTAPTLPKELIPSCFLEWVDDIAERMQVGLELVAVPAIVALSSVLGRRCGIKPKRHDDWLVTPQLWGAVVARPGAMKTPAISEALKPLKILEQKARKEFEDSQSIRAAEAECLKAQIESINYKIKETLKKQNSNQPDLENFKLQLTELKMKEVGQKKNPKRYSTNDSTVEKLASLLEENPMGLLYNRDELYGFFKTMDKQGHECDRAFYLESWNGSNAYTVDRVGKGTLHVPALCLSILGGIQPGRLQQYVSEAILGGAGDDGLIQRFQLFVFPESNSQWQHIDRPPNVAARNQANLIFEKFSQITPVQIGAEQDHPEAVPWLKFSSDAQDLFDAWLRDLEQRLRSEELGSPAFESHLSKYRSLMPSLALVLHLIEFVTGATTVNAVSIESTQKAAALCDFFEAHAKKIYSAAINADVLAAHALGKKIRNGTVKSGDKLRDIHRKQWSLLDTSKKVVSALSVLKEYGWVRTQILNDDSPQESEVIYLNPHLLSS